MTCHTGLPSHHLDCASICVQHCQIIHRKWLENTNTASQTSSSARVHSTACTLLCHTWAVRSEAFLHRQLWMFDQHRKVTFCRPNRRALESWYAEQARIWAHYVCLCKRVHVWQAWLNGQVFTGGAPWQGCIQSQWCTQVKGVLFRMYNTTNASVCAVTLEQAWSVTPCNILIQQVLAGCNMIEAWHFTWSIVSKLTDVSHEARDLYQ